MAATTIYSDPSILYSADLNQTSIHRVATTGARDTLYPSPVAGNVCYVIGTGLQMYSGSAWVTAIQTSGLPTSDALKLNLSGGTITGATTNTSYFIAQTYYAAVLGGGGYGFMHTSDGAGNLLAAFVTGEANARFNINSVGTHTWGAGGATAVDTNLYRSAADKLKTDDMLITAIGLGVGNSAAASVIPTANLVKKIQVFDASGTSLGYIPVYSSIT